MLEQLLIENEWLKLPYSRIIINNTNSTLVPLALFNEAEKGLYAGFNQIVPETDTVSFDTLRNTQAVNVYSNSEILSAFIGEKWPEAKTIHYSSCVIESMGNQFKNISGNKTLFVNVREEVFDILYFKEAKLFYYNNFRFKSNEDFIYFLLLAMEQLGLSPEEAKLGMSGKIDEGSGIYQILHEYIRHHHFIERNDSYQYSELLNEATCRQYYVLLNVLQCA